MPHPLWRHNELRDSSPSTPPGNPPLQRPKGQKVPEIHHEDKNIMIDIMARNAATFNQILHKDIPSSAVTKILKFLNLFLNSDPLKKSA